MGKDLRYFINYIKSVASEELLTVEREVDPRIEISAVLRKLQEVKKYPIVFFKRVKGSKMPIITNVTSTVRKLGLILEIEETREDLMLSKYMELENKRILPQIVDSGPVKDVRMVGNDVDLGKLPLRTHNDKDAAPYIGLGIAIVKDPETGKRNAGIYRMMHKGKNRIGFWAAENTHFSFLRRKFDARDQPMEVAVFIGHHPACVIGSQANIPFGVDELEVMGGLMGEPIELVKCETVDLEVPAYAEIVIEGKILPNIREPEAPFGEYTLYYGPQRKSPVFEVTGITHRKDAIFYEVFAAHMDHQGPSHFPREAGLYRRIRSVLPQLVAVRSPLYGVKHMAYVKIRKDQDGLGKFAGIAALSYDPFLKIVVVVDDDVDIYNEEEILWAMTTRTQPDVAFTIIPNVKSAELDPSAHSIFGKHLKDSMNAKCIIDCTKPVGYSFEERADVSREIWDKIVLEDYIKGWKG